MHPILALGNRESCLGPVFLPLTIKNQYSYQILFLQMDIFTSLDKIK